MKQKQAIERNLLILFNLHINGFEFVDYLDKESKELNPLYEYINSESDEWVSCEKVFLLKFKKYCKEHSYVNK